MSLVAANAVLYPHVVVHVYGLEVQAAALPFVYILADILAGCGLTDVSAHAGGAACGWTLAQRWKS